MKSCIIKTCEFPVTCEYNNKCMTAEIKAAEKWRNHKNKLVSKKKLTESSQKGESAVKRPG